MVSKIIFKTNHYKQQKKTGYHFLKKIIAKIFNKKMKEFELLIFIQSICEFLKVNRDLYFCIESSLHCLNNNKKKIFMNILSKMQQGENLSSAIICFDIFPFWMIKIIKSGEKNNNLLQAFYVLKDFLIWRIENKKKLKNALTYPIFTFFVFICVVFLFSNYIAPQIFSLLDTFNNNATENYQMFLWFLFILKSFIYTILLLCVILCVCRIFVKKSYEKIIFFIPIFGKFFQYQAIYVNAYYIHSSLLQGNTINDSFDVALDSNQGIVRDILMQVKIDLNKGLKINQSLQKLKFIPSMLIKIIKIGEDSGNLENSFYLTKQIFFDKSQILIDKLINFLPIILIFSIAIMMISFILLVFMPLYNINTNI